MSGILCDVNNHANISHCVSLTSEYDFNCYCLARKGFSFQSISPQVLIVFMSIGIIFGVSMLVLLIGVIVSRYLLQSVTCLTSWLQFTPETMSYIVIPLMNGAPDIINSHLMIKSKSVNLVIGEIIGANLTSFTVILGCISILRPFTIETRRTLMISFTFICSVIVLLSYILLDGRITFFECLILTLLYPVYITLLSFDYHETPDLLDLERTLSKDLVTETSHLLVHQIPSREDLNAQVSPNFIWMMLNNFVSFIANTMDRLLAFFIPVTHSNTAQPSSTVSYFEQNFRHSIWFHLWMVFVSILLMDRCFFGLSPGTLIYLMAITFVITRGLSSVFSLEASNILLIIICIMNSFFMMIIITRLVIQLLKSLGEIWGVSDYIMGLLVFSLVSCMNDILMNIMLAIECSPSLGVKACMGSCCLLISVGVGLNGLWDLSTVALQTDSRITLLSLPVSVTLELYVSLLALNSTVILTLIYMALNKWRLDRKLGIGLLAMWVIVTVTCISIEYK